MQVQFRVFEVASREVTEVSKLTDLAYDTTVPQNSSNGASVVHGHVRDKGPFLLS